MTTVLTIVMFHLILNLKIWSQGFRAITLLLWLIGVTARGKGTEPDERLLKLSLTLSAMGVLLQINGLLHLGLLICMLAFITAKERPLFAATALAWLPTMEYFLGRTINAT